MFKFTLQEKKLSVCFYCIIIEVIIEIHKLLLAETADIRTIINLKLTIAKLFPICSKLGKVGNWRTVSEKEMNTLGKNQFRVALRLHSITMELTYLNDKHGPWL